MGWLDPVAVLFVIFQAAAMRSSGAAAAGLLHAAARTPAPPSLALQALLCGSCRDLWVLSYLLLLNQTNSLCPPPSAAAWGPPSQYLQLLVLA